MHDAVNQTSILYSVVTELEEGNAPCRREAAWVLLNMCECGGAQDSRAALSIVDSIVSNGGISAICGNLDRDSDAGTEPPELGQQARQLCCCVCCKVQYVR